MMYEFAAVYNYEKLYMTAALLLAITLTVILIVYTFWGLIRKEQRIALLLLYIIILIYQTAQFLAIMSPPRELMVFTLIQGAAFCLLGPGFLLYSYTTRYHRFPSVRQWAAVWFLPLLGVIFVLSNEAHHQFFSVYDIFYIQYHKLYFFIYLINSIYTLGGLLLLDRGQEQEGTGLIRRFLFDLPVMIILLGTGIFQYLKPGFSHYSLLFIAISIVQVYFTVRYRDNISSKSVLSARMRALDFINEAVILTDPKQCVLYHNQAPFNQIIGAEIGKEIETLLKERITLTEREFSFHERGEDLDYAYYVQSLGSGQPTGILYTFRDISKYKKLIRELERKSQELKAISEKLSEYTKVVRTLTEEKERNRILEQIHSTVGLSITQIIRLIREIEMLDEADTVPIKERIQKSINFAREGIREIRQAVSTLNKQGVG